MSGTVPDPRPARRHVTFRMDGPDLDVVDAFAASERRTRGDMLRILISDSLTLRYRLANGGPLVPARPALVHTARELTREPVEETP